jgi:protoheme IX farnesyltransferase
MKVISEIVPLFSIVLDRISSYRELMKLRLSLLVAFSSGFGYALAFKGVIDYSTLFALSFGGLLISGASIALNQIAEMDYDRLMDRTKNRPLPTAKISTFEAYTFALIVGVSGLVILSIYTNWLTILLSVVSIILYSFVYTPLKRVGPIAVFVGAIPGALPPLIGWVAATGTISIEAMIIFGIQFIWQFPHFWAIAWVADDDYKKAGFKLLPFNGKKDLRTAINIMIYTLFLLPLGLLPAYVGITGIHSAFVVTLCGVLFLSQTLTLMKDPSRKSALKIMFGSIIYLPIVQISFLLDKL